MYVDCHCHLDICEDIEKCVKNAREKSVLIVSAGVDSKTNRKTIDLKEKYGIKVCLGIYPVDALKLSESELEKEIDFIRKNKKNLVAIGEVGLDFKESEEKERQIRIFERFIELSNELDKPIIVHSRKAEEECIEALEKMNSKKVVMHCFSGNFRLVKKIADNGWYLTIPANVKFSEHFQKVAEMIDIKQLLCETDSPYLHPEKKWPNEPANVIESYKKIAKIKKMKLKDVEKQIEENYKKLFQ